MKKLTLKLSLIGALSLSPALAQVQTGLDRGLHKPTPSLTATATKKELVRPVVRLPTKPKLLRSNPYRFAATRLADSDPWAVPDDEDIIAARHRLTVVQQRLWDPDLDISNYAQARLTIARALALAKYREKWS